MKNGNLMVNGNPADTFIPEDQTTNDAFLDFEFKSYAAYDAIYGDNACEQDGINTLADLYGQEFNDRFFRARVKFMATRNILEVQKRIARDTLKVANLQKLIDNPTTNLEDVFNT